VLSRVSQNLHLDWRTAQSEGLKYSTKEIWREDFKFASLRVLALQDGTEGGQEATSDKAKGKEDGQGTAGPNYERQRGG